MGVALPPDLGGLQDAGVAQLDQHFLTVEPAGLALVVGLDAADKVGLSGHHLRQQVHEGKLETRGAGSEGRTGNYQNKSVGAMGRTHPEVGGNRLRPHVGGFSRVVRRLPRLTGLKHTQHSQYKKPSTSPLKVKCQ